jgi:hypothetical protein
MPLNKARHQLLGGDQTLLIFSHIFFSFDWCKELWKHQAKLYISSFSSKSKPVTQRKKQSILKSCNMFLFKQCLISRSHIFNHIKIYGCTTLNLSFRIWTLEIKEQHKISMKNNDYVEILNVN